jgi:2-oxoglutarate/2-oxoacid ferredoxin oxidoreductase subunit alpha
MNSNFFRSVIKVAGESGSLSTAGNIIINALRQLGLFIYSEREFPSLIKGGRANVQINYSNQQIRSMSHNIPIAVALDREGVLDCLDTLSDGGVLIHGFDRWNKAIKDLVDRASSKNLQIIEVPAREIAAENGGGVIMVNTVLMGVLFQTLGLSFDSLENSLRKELVKKPSLLEINIRCAKAGFNFIIPDELNTEAISILTERFKSLNKNKTIEEIITVNLDLSKESEYGNGAKSQTDKNLFLDGNSAIALGSLSAGCRAYYAYPMSPATTVLIQLAKWATMSGMLVKQAEDEITAVQMALGSMHAGTRAFTTTSGGGFDLMTETISLAGIIETPLVVAISQRPGPGTGLPTWTAQGDLSLAIYSGHGEYGKCVIACSDPITSFENIQFAFNTAEKYQIPVILLTEANIAMSSVVVNEQDLVKIEIERGLSTSNDNERYEITESGLSPRWLPGSSDKIYYANGDEHWIDGSITEEADKAGEMYAKRLRKTEILLKDLPEPIVFGVEANADISFVGWGSTKNTILDAMDILTKSNPEIKVNYLHYNFVYPLKTNKLAEFLANNKNIVLIEGNATGQLGELITTKTGYLFQNKMLKWNGRPFYIEEVIEKIKNYKKS